MPKISFRDLPAVVAILIGAALVAAIWLPARHLSVAIVIWAVCLGAALAVFTAAILWLGMGAARPWRLWRACLPSFVLLISSFGYLLIIESTVGSYLLAAVVTALVGSHLSQVRSVLSDESPDDPALAYLANLVGLAGLFLFLAFLYGINSYYYISMPLLGLAAAALVAGLAGESLAGFGLSSAELPVVVVVFGALEFQAYVGFSFLPTGSLVNATVNIILFAVSLYVVRMIMRGAGEVRYFRRELALSFLSIAVLLATAGWF
ncbi:MAG: hypothetical protein WCT10_01930 [Patescibacteria group bacterium]|jgi:hypothetical protein